MKTSLHHFLLILLLLCFNLNLSSQITTTGGLNAQQLAEILAGSNITVSNATITGPNLGYGSFSTTGNFPFGSGVILTNGELSNAAGPNNDPNTSDNLGGDGTAEMDALGGAASYDVITLEFDFVVQSSSIQFQYIFASEEYPEFAPPNTPSFNDVFAFYISGPGIVGEENIALIPSTTDPVSIDNVNAVTNQQYYVDNIGGTEVQFDGYTTDLIASRAGLTACQTYHLRMVIADIQTSNRNSAVFLKENSFVQENVLGAETQTINSDDIALEGCVMGSFAFEFTELSTEDRTITFSIGGTAVNGVDYSYIDNYITIPAGELSGTVYIDAFSDGLTEGPETITITYNSGVCVGTETVTLTINDAQPINFTLDGTNLDCFGDNSGEILVNATGGFPGYTYVVTNPEGITTNYTSNPITGLAAGEYSVQVNDTYGCKAEALVIGGQFNAGTTFLPDGSGVTYEAPLVISGFNPGQTITTVDQIQQICLTMEHSYLGDLWIRVESPSGQTVTLKQQDGGASCDLGEPIATGPVDGTGSSDVTPGVGYEYCFNASPVFGTMVNESANFFRNYTDGVGNAYSDNYLPAGSYTASGNFSNLVGSQMNGTWKVFVTDQFGLDNGYIFNWYISLIGDLPDTTIVLTQPDDFNISGIANNATCGVSNGAINISVLNGAEPLSYSWSNGAITEDLANIGAGEYTVTVTDNNGCSKSQSFIVNNTGTLALTSEVTPVTCYGGNNGAIIISPSGGTSPYTFSWSNGELTQNISNLIGGDYTVTMTDLIGCQYSQVITVDQSSQIVPTISTYSNEICNTDNGFLTINVNGGNGSYGYLWSNGATTQNINNLTSGNYTINVTDGLGCTGSATFPIANNLTGCSNFCYLDIELNELVNSTCGNANGSIDINILDAATPYTINWSDGSLSEDIGSLTPGTFTVTVVDANNCSKTASFTVQNNSGDLSITNYNINNSTCGYDNGSIDIAVNGGTGPYDYLWSNSSTNEDLTNLSSGNYSVTITDDVNCTITQSFTLENDPGNLIIEGTSSSSVCTSNNGSITQTIISSFGTVSYAWNTGQSSQNLTNLAPGTYTCTATDASGCSVTNSYTVGQLNGDLSLSGTLITNEMCDNNQGAINITVTGNSLTYLWSNGAITEDISGLNAGNYSCTISNAQGCSISTGSISIINSPGTLVVSNQAVIHEICNNNNGSIDVNVYNGQSPFTYLWSNGAITEDISGLDEGVYTLQLTDFNGCTLAHSVEINNSPGTLAVSSSTLIHESCIAGTGTNGAGSIDIEVSGASGSYTYLWNNGEVTQDISGLSDGTYTVSITSTDACTLNQTFTILPNGSNMAIESVSITDESCGSQAGAINISLSSDSGPYSFDWSNGSSSEDLSDLESGTYTLTVNNSYGCSITEDFVVGNDAGTLAVSGAVSNENCGDSDGSIDLSASGGNEPVSFEWSNGAITEDLSSLSAGTYSVVVTDLYGCSQSFNGIVSNISNGLDLQLSSVTDENCGQGDGAIDVNITGSGNYTYLWSNGEITEDLTGIDAGTYTLTVTDDLFCSASITATVENQTGTLALSFTNVQNEICGNGEGYIDIEVSGPNPITYSWSNSEITQDLVNLSSGTYTVEITDGLGCILSESFEVGNTNLSNISASADIQNVYCNSTNGAINLTMTSGIVPFTFLWSTSDVTEDVSGLSSGTYSVTITDGANCQTTESYFINSQMSDLEITSIDIYNDFCNDGQGALSVNYVGLVNGFFLDGVDMGSEFMFGLYAGNYEVMLTDVYGCSLSQNVTIENDAFFNLNSTQVNASCGLSNGSIDLSVTGGGGPGGYTYSWSNGATSQDLNNVPAGTYTVTVTSGGPNPCTDVLTVVLENEVDFVINGTQTDDYCNGGIGAIDQTIVSGSGMTYLWSNGETTEDLSSLSEGTYICTVSLAGGCTEEYSYIIVNETSGASVSYDGVNELCSNASGSIDLTVTGGVGPFDYSWSNSEITEDLSGLSAGDYSVIVTDQNDNCSFTEIITILDDQTIFDPSSNITHATCASCTDGAIDLTIANSSNYTFDWSNGADTEDVGGLLPGNYSVLITSMDGCDTTVNFTVLNTAGLDDLSVLRPSIHLFPNPAMLDFNVEYVLPEGMDAELEITDMFGKLIAEQKIQQSGSAKFSTENLASGIYFVTLKTADYKEMKRLVVQTK